MTTKQTCHISAISKNCMRLVTSQRAITFCKTFFLYFFTNFTFTGWPFTTERSSKDFFFSKIYPQLDCVHELHLMPKFYKIQFKKINEWAMVSFRLSVIFSRFLLLDISLFFHLSKRTLFLLFRVNFHGF
jgi:hypothetical protein